MNDPFLRVRVVARGSVLCQEQSRSSNLLGLGLELFEQPHGLLAVEQRDQDVDECRTLPPVLARSASGAMNRLFGIGAKDWQIHRQRLQVAPPRADRLLA